MASKQRKHSTKSEDIPPAPAVPFDDIMARHRRTTEQARQELERAQDDQRERDRRVKAANDVQDLGAAYHLELKRDNEYLLQWVKAMAAYKAVLPAWPNRNVPPADVTNDHGRDAWQWASTIFLKSEKEPDWAVEKLADLATTPDLAASVADWLRRGIRRVCEPAPVVREAPPPPAPPHTDGGQAGVKRRPCYERDHLWLEWNKEGLGPKKILPRWNQHCEQHGGTKLPDNPSSVVVIKEGLKKAKTECKKGG